MAKWGSFEFDEFKRMADAFKHAKDTRVIERFIREFLTEMAYRALAKIKRRTPVDTGDLRRNWFVSKVVRKGDAYEIELYNNIEYAGYVEYGHRTVNSGGMGWVPGRFMATISMDEIERELPKYLERRQLELLDQIMNGRKPKR